MLGSTVGGQWRVEGELGRGSFSTVYYGVNVTTLEPVAIKVVRSVTPKSLLDREIRVLVRLQGCESRRYVGVPKLLYSENRDLVLVMERVGRTLLELYTATNSISLKSLFMVALQVLTVLEEIHCQGVVHNDLKPDNIATGYHTYDEKLYLIDFGLSTEFRLNGVHVNYSEDWKFRGTPYFASEHALRGVRPSRRDDLESLCYVLVFFQLGTLPWLDIPIHSPTSLLDMIDARSNTLQFIQTAHSVFPLYFNYVRSLSFAQEPDYTYLRKLFEDAMESESLVCDWGYDWKKGSQKTRVHSHSNSLSRNMSLLSSNGDSSPGGKILQLHQFRRNSTESLSSVSTPTHAPALDGSRIRQFSQRFLVNEVRNSG